MEKPEKTVRPEVGEKFVIVHLGKTKDGVSVMNSKGFATAVKLSEHVKTLVEQAKH